MSILTSALPKALTIDGTDYPINTDFRAVLLYDEKLPEADSGASVEDVLAAMSAIYTQRIPSNIEEAAKQLSWFVRCGKTEEKRFKPSKKVLGINSEQAIDFREDAQLIYSAFRRNDVYGIDLIEIPYLHWWQFMAMLDDLPGDVQLSKVMQYRTIDINAIQGKKEKEFYRSMQRYHKIRHVDPQEQAENEELIKALMEGRDPTPYL